ncbi:MAG TPA: hypothetical protein VN229_15990, partial [Terriglobales bacterium]|nr:hypothetical protein [Terriglobales bacterium]
RRHSRDDAISFCDEMRQRRPDIVFGADIIAGFPTETEAMFVNSLDLVERCGITYLHVFPYSARERTPAAKMPQVPGDIRRDRAARLRTLGEGALRRHFASQIGRTAELVVEAVKADGSVFGHSRDFMPIRVIDPARRLNRGNLVTVRLLHHTDTELIAEPAVAVAA